MQAKSVISSVASALVQAVLARIVVDVKVKLKAGVVNSEVYIGLADRYDQTKTAVDEGNASRPDQCAVAATAGLKPEAEKASAPSEPSVAGAQPTAVKAVRLPTRMAGESDDDFRYRVFLYAVSIGKYRNPKVHHKGNDGFKLNGYLYLEAKSLLARMRKVEPITATELFACLRGKGILVTQFKDNTVAPGTGEFTPGYNPNLSPAHSDYVKRIPARMQPNPGPIEQDNSANLGRAAWRIRSASNGTNWTSLVVVQINDSIGTVLPSFADFESGLQKPMVALAPSFW